MGLNLCTCFQTDDDILQVLPCLLGLLPAGPGTGGFLHSEAQSFAGWVRQGKELDKTPTVHWTLD